MAAKIMPGFYASDSEVYYHENRKTWIVASGDDLGTDDPVEIDGLPEGATRAGDLLSPEEQTEHLRRIERAFGEVLVDPAVRVGVDREVAEAYFAAGGTVEVQPKGYSLAVLFPISAKTYRSFQHGMAEFAREGWGNPEYLIDPDYPHPANPVKRDAASPENSFVVS